MPEAAVLPRERQLESLRADQIARWHQGERRLVESYLDDAPDLRTDHDAVLDLIYTEVVVREELGEAPSATEYLRRFPHLEAALGRQFTVHRLLEAPSLRAASIDEKALPVQARRASAASLTPIPPTVLDEGTIQLARPDVPSVPGYEILAELGRGGMGVVYKARQTRLNRLVALKLIRSPGEDVSSRFRTEAETAARLQHPNIVQIHECGESVSGPYVALEYVDGDSLAHTIDGTPLPPRDAAELLLPLARAMHYAHGHGVIHRDLKPANVLLSFSRERSASVDLSVREPINPRSRLNDALPKIADFGLAKSLDADSGQTQSGAVLGTPSYMAPEQASGHSREVGPAADVYALGAILYEMLTGRPPFKAATAMETMQQVVGEEPVPPRRLQSATPRDLETICLKCLRKEPHKRYASAVDLAGDLQHFLAGEPIRARPIATWERFAKWARRYPTTAAMILLTLTATVGALVVWASFTRQLEKQRDTARDMQQRYENERNKAVSQETEVRRQRDETLRLLKINLAAVRDHAQVVVEGKQADVRTKNPGEVLYQLACAYARSAEAFRTDASLAPDNAHRISEEYADCAMILLLAAAELGYFEKEAICFKLDQQKELELLSERREFKQLRLPKGRGMFSKP